MDEQEAVKQIRELQKQRTSLKEQDTVLALKIMELRDVLREGNIKKECYYTDTYGLFCKVYDIKGGKVLYKEYIAIRCKDGDVGFYTPTQCDVLAEDWEVVTK